MLFITEIKNMSYIDSKGSYSGQHVKDFKNTQLRSDITIYQLSCLR